MVKCPIINQHSNTLCDKWQQLFSIYCRGKKQHKIVLGLISNHSVTDTCLKQTTINSVVHDKFRGKLSFLQFYWTIVRKQCVMYGFLNENKVNKVCHIMFGANPTDPSLLYRHVMMY